MFARENDFCMNFYKWSLCSSFIGSICTRNFDIFMQWLLVFFKISHCSCITVPMFARKVELFMLRLQVFNKIYLSSCLEVTRQALYCICHLHEKSVCVLLNCFLDSLWPQISQIVFRSSWKYLRGIFSKLLDTTFYWQLSLVNMSHIALLGNDWSEHEILLTGWINPCQYNFSELLNSMDGQKCLCPHSHQWNKDAWTHGVFACL